MKTCYIAIGRGLAQATWWERYAKSKASQKIFDEEDLVIGVDWTLKNENKDESARVDTVYLTPQLYEEEKGMDGLPDVWRGKRVISRMSHYAEKFAHRFDAYFNTDELQVVFLTSSAGDFFMGEVPEIINFLITKIACTFPQCKLHVRTIVYSSEFYKERKPDPGEVLYEKTGWFLERHLAERGKRKALCEEDELYVIDKDCCSFEDLFYSIGFETRLLRKMDRTDRILDKKGWKGV